MLAKISGVFRLARDIEIRYTQSGTAIANVGLVSSEKYKTQTGEQKEDVCFVDATAFGRLGEILNQYLHKGSRVYIEGRLKLEQWDAQDGSKRSRHTIKIENMEMLDGKNDGQSKPNQDSNYTPRERPEQQAQSQIPEIDISSDEIPFGYIGLSEGGYYQHLI